MRTGKLGVIALVTFIPILRSALTQLRVQVPSLEGTLARTISESHHVPLVAIVGVVQAEHTLNVSVVDGLQDQLLRTRLRMHDEQWWSDWAHRAERLVMHADQARLLANKWPQELVATGYVLSYGPAQLTPRSVLRSCRVVSDRHPACHQTVKQIMSQLLSPQSVLALVGIVLDAEATEWERQSRYPVRKDVALLGTLYSMGGDYYRYRHPDVALPVYNRFGKWIAERCKAIAVEVHASVSECPGT